MDSYLIFLVNSTHVQMMYSYRIHLVSSTHV